jgi:urease accessory protein
MEEHITHTNLKSISKFLQVLDTSFPSGSFIHSFGLEPHITLGKVSTASDLKKFLKNIVIDQYQSFDLVFMKKYYNYFAKNNLSLVDKSEREFTAMLPYKYAKASVDIGASYLKQIKLQADTKIVKEYFEGVVNKKYLGNEICILSAYAYDIDMSLEMLLLFWFKKNLTNIAMTSIKISRITPSQIQRVLFELDDFIISSLDLISNNVSMFNPLFEEAIYMHEKLEPKLFAT